MKAGELLRFLLLVIVPTLLVIPAARLLFHDPPADDPDAWIKACLATNNKHHADELLTEQIQRHPCNVRYHYLRLSIRLEDDASDQAAERLSDEYLTYASSPDPNLADIGCLGLGCIHLEKKQPKAALHTLAKIQNRRLRYLSLLTGRGYEAVNQFDKAVIEYEQEIEHKGNINGAVRAMAMLLCRTDDFKGLEALYARRELRPYFPSAALRRLAARDRQPLRYITGMIQPLVRRANPIGLIGAVAILLAWSWFLHRLDMFEPEKLVWVIVALAGGMLSAFGSTILYGWLHWDLGFSEGGGFWNDLVYCIFGIGLVEEGVKIIPVLLLIRFSRQVDESIDFLIYASLCALGFSFIENILYFDEYSLDIINERGMLCSIGHMFYTSLACYGFVLARYRRWGNPFGNFFLFFLLACVYHGLYDFFLITDSIPKTWMLLSIALGLAEPVFYVRMLNNALNQSEFFDPAVSRRFGRMREMLGLMLVAVVLFEFLGMASRYGPTLTAIEYRPVIGFTWFLVLFFSTTLGTYRIRRQYWLPVWGREKPNKKSQPDPD